MVGGGPFLPEILGQPSPVSSVLLLVGAQFGLDSTVMTHYKTILTTSPYQLIAPAALSHC